MNNTALGAENKKEQTIKFISVHIPQKQSTRSA